MLHRLHKVSQRLACVQAKQVRCLCTAEPTPDAVFAELFRIRRAGERAQDGFALWGTQQRKKKPLDSQFTDPHLEDLVKPCTVHTLLLPFKSDEDLWSQYVNPSGELRFGKILEDIDAFAGNISYFHCDDDDPETEPLTLVTASCDRYRPPCTAGRS